MSAACQPSTASGRSTASRWRGRLRTLWQSLVTPVITTSLYFIVFGAAIGSRMTEVGGVPYGAFIVPGLIMLSLFTAEHLQRQLRHLLPEVHRHDLRAAVGADLAARDGDRLCRRGGDQVDRARPRHPRHRRLLRADPDRPPVLDGGLPGADRGDLLPVRLHHRHLGQEFRADPVHPDADRHPAHLPRRRLLLDRHAAASRGGRSPCSTRSSI